jgi:hypothetical protein
MGHAKPKPKWGKKLLSAYPIENLILIILFHYTPCLICVYFGTLKKNPKPKWGMLSLSLSLSLNLRDQFRKMHVPSVKCVSPIDWGQF